MSNNVALITGGAKGIGRAIALDLAAQQWSVAICYRTSVAAADETGKAIVARGGQALVLQCDVSDPEAAKRLVSQVERKWGRIDALINGAGPYHRVNLFDETTAGLREMFDGNLHPIFYLAQAVAPGMKARKWGRIISFSMANADQMVAQPDVTGHYIAKAGVLILTRTLAKLLAPHGITVNAIRCSKTIAGRKARPGSRRSARRSSPAAACTPAAFPSRSISLARKPPPGTT